MTRDQFALWLAAGMSSAELLGLLRPLPADEIEAIAVGPTVNNARNEGPECARPAAA